MHDCTALPCVLTEFQPQEQAGFFSRGMSHSRVTALSFATGPCEQPVASQGGPLASGIEQGPAHAGDSACSIPPQTIPESCLETMRDWTKKLAKDLNVVGLINVQFAVQDGQVCAPPLPIPLLTPRDGTRQLDDIIANVSMLTA